jgi:hypothetical protein
MSRSKIKYIGFYDSDIYANENRNSFLSAANKMDYICQAIVELSKKVQFENTLIHNSRYKAACDSILSR